MKIKENLFIVLLILFSFWSCQDLAVRNPNEPDADQALTNPADIENLLGGAYRAFHNPITNRVGSNSTGGLSFLLTIIGEELTASWTNSGMQDVSSEPRVAYNNSTTYAFIGGLNSGWDAVYEAISPTIDFYRAYHNGFEFLDENGVDNTNRNRAFAEFVLGVSHGFAALVYDKALILNPTDPNFDLESVDLDYKPYQEVANSAIEHFQNCITLADANSFSIPEEWFGGVMYNNSQISQFAHTWIARLIAYTPRSKTERESADWASVLTHTNSGLTSNFTILTDDDDDGDWNSEFWYRSSLSSTFRVDYHCLGPADNSGGYQNWLNTPLLSRTAFRIETDDKRISGLNDNPDLGKYFEFLSEIVFRPERGTYHQSHYSYTGFRYIIDQNRSGEVPVGSVAENDFLKAEAHYMLNNTSAAADIINFYRTTNGELPAVTGNDPDLFDILKYEKRLETFAHHYGGVPYFDRRGWGELVVGTPIHFPVPAPELELALQPFYTFGGIGGVDAAPANPEVDGVY